MVIGAVLRPTGLKCGQHSGQMADNAADFIAKTANKHHGCSFALRIERPLGVRQSLRFCGGGSTNGRQRSRRQEQKGCRGQLSDRRKAA